VPHAQLILPCARSSLSRLRSRRMCSRRWRVIALFQYLLTPPRVRGVSGSAELEPFRSRPGPLRDKQRLAPQSNPFALSSSPRAPQRVGAVQALDRVLRAGPVKRTLTRSTRALSPSNRQSLS
jgi:hypothetical protein